jgi:hypothetical protein
LPEHRASCDAKPSIGVLPVLVALFLTFAGEAQGQALDLTNPKARMISVSFENSDSELPGALDRKYGTPVQGWFVPGPGPGQALVRIPASQVEGMLSGYKPVPGTFSDFVWIFDIQTGHVESASFAGVVRSTVSWGFFEIEVETAIVTEMRTSVSAGFRQPEKRFGQMVFSYCEDASLACHRIQPAPLDARSGYVNAVGSMRAVALGGIETECFSPMGEAIFREIVPTPIVSAGP